MTDSCLSAGLVLFKPVAAAAGALGGGENAAFISADTH